MNSENASEFAKRYTKAWCSQNPECVAAFFAENASFTVNGGPAELRLWKSRADFMRDLPNMTVTFDKLEPHADRTAFPLDANRHVCRKGNHVRIGGYELWKINNAGLIAESKGHLDTAQLERQFQHGIDPSCLLESPPRNGLE